MILSYKYTYKLNKYEKILEIIDKRNKIQIKIDNMILKMSSYNNDLFNMGICNYNDELLIKKLLEEYYNNINIKILNKDINDPDLYYYNLYDNNVKYYYSLLTNRKIPKSEIPLNILHLIK